MADQLTLTGVAAPVGAHDEGDRYYTPDSLAWACCSAIVARCPSIAPVRVVEPSVGGGAFVRAIRRKWGATIRRLDGFDIDPDAAGLRDVNHPWVADWAKVGTSISPDLILGNPPFSGDTAIEHVNTARLCIGKAGVVAFILPLSYLGVQRWDRLVSEAAGVGRIVGRPWPVLREVALYVWTERANFERGMFRVQWEG